MIDSLLNDPVIREVPDIIEPLIPILRSNSSWRKELQWED